MIEAIVVYDIRTEDPAGQRRLRAVAKACEGLGRRVQYSVFEMRCNEAQLIRLKAQLLTIIAPDDSVRFYRVGGGTLDRVEQIGCRTPLPLPDAVIL